MPLFRLVIEVKFALNLNSMSEGVAVSKSLVRAWIARGWIEGSYLNENPPTATWTPIPDNDLLQEIDKDKNWIEILGLRRGVVVISTTEKGILECLS